MSLYSHKPQIKTAERPRDLCVCVCQCQMLRHKELPRTGLMYDKGTHAQTYTSEEVADKNRKLDHAPGGHTHTFTHLRTPKTGRKEGRKATHTHTHTHLSVCESYLDTLYPESQGGR